MIDQTIIMDTSCPPRASIIYLLVDRIDRLVHLQALTSPANCGAPRRSCSPTSKAWTWPPPSPTCRWMAEPLPWIPSRGGEIWQPFLTCLKVISIDGGVCGYNLGQSILFIIMGGGRQLAVGSLGEGELLSWGMLELSRGCNTRHRNLLSCIVFKMVACAWVWQRIIVIHC